MGAGFPVGTRVTWTLAGWNFTGVVVATLPSTITVLAANKIWKLPAKILRAR